MNCKECDAFLWTIPSQTLGICMVCREEDSSDAIDLEDRLEAALAVENKQEVLL